MSSKLRWNNISEIIIPVWVTIVIGITSGFTGMLLSLLLHYIQHFAYGYSLDQIISDISFLEGVIAAPPERRVIALCACGLIAGIGWFGLYRFGKPLKSISTAITSKTPQMPFFTTTIHVLLQIITVALGSPLGREVAPREMGAVVAGVISTKAGLSIKRIQLMMACGAGAGFAAVYNVPFAGALFTLEVLLGTLHFSALIPAFTTSGIAVAISWIGLGNHQIYHFPPYNISYSLVVWSIISGPIFGVSAYWFIRIARHARKNAKRNWQMPFLCILNFFMIGLLAIYFPALLGNGKSPAYLAFTDTTSIGYCTALLILHTLIVWSSLRVGAYGGLLFPSLANGALLGLLLAAFWQFFVPGVDLGAFAIVGGVAFLAAAQKMPITAIIFFSEISHINFSFLIPFIFAISGAMAVLYLCENTFEKTV